jgi:ABC-type transport system substrate-binding protein
VGDRLTFEKNKNYWRPNRPYLDGVTVQVYRDAQSMVTAMESGTLDAVLDPPIRDFDRLKKDSKYNSFTVQSGTNVIGANTTLPPTDNKLLRQAINYAIDRKRIAESVYLNVGEPKDLIWSAVSPAYDAVKANLYTFDLDKSKALIARSGLTNITFDIVTVRSSDRRR